MKRKNNQKERTERSGMGSSGVRPCMPNPSSNHVLDSSLPVCECKEKIIENVRSHNQCLIISETGTGKSTKIPQFLFELIRENQKIICTQPRRIAAVSLAQRVSSDLGSKLGDTVGYMIRFENMFTEATKLIYATDGSLLRESITDTLLSKYEIIILDEAHQRSMHTDILFGVIKRAIVRRKQLGLDPFRLVIMSATVCVDKFSKYFSAKVLYIEGRNYPISIFYVSTPITDHFSATYQAISQIHGSKPLNQSILVFMSGQDEINSLKDILTHRFSNMFVFPLFAALPLRLQLKVFQFEPGKRKVILSTNIAETSITIPGIHLVIDTGLVKKKIFDPSTLVTTLTVGNISRAEARQRAGRAGRLGPGSCYRLYTESEYIKEFNEDPVPELIRSNISSVILVLLSSGIKNPLDFDWIDPPSEDLIRCAYDELVFLGAVENDLAGTPLTSTGHIMSRLPIDPRFSKVLVLSGTTYKCSAEMITIIALLSEKDFLFTSPSSYENKKISKNREKYVSEYGDIITLLNIWNAYFSLFVTKPKPNSKVNGSEYPRLEVSLDHWCESYGINRRSLSNIKKLKKQLFLKLKSLNIPIISAQSHFPEIQMQIESILLALYSGFYDYTATYDPVSRAYKTLLFNEQVQIHPSSFIHGRRFHLIFCSEKIVTNSHYIRNVCVFRKEWIEKLQLKTEIVDKIWSYIRSIDSEAVIYS